MSKHNGKNPFAKQQPKTGKHVRGPAVAASTDGVTIAWHLSTIDKDGPFGWCHVGQSCYWDRIHQKLASFETMTWNDIVKGSHPVELKDLSKEARKRLEEIQQDDIESLYSLRLTGTERIWGIRDRNFLKVLWWDPNHKVCPSNKRNT